MTVCAAWTRRLGSGCEELWFATDSRLSGGGRIIDNCPKALPLPRGDCAIAFDGDIDIGYPLLLQASSAVQAYRRSLTRALDLRELKTHLIKILNRLADGMSDTLPETALPSVSFLFGGYSWIHKSFDLWRIGYNRGIERFTARPAPTLPNDAARVVFSGDQGRNAKRRFYTILRNRHGLSGKTLDTDRINLEPFEVIRDMLREDASRTIGGPPQLVKVYQHLNATPVAVFWPDIASQSIALTGRMISGFEDIDHWVLDPDGLETYHMDYTPDERWDEVLRSAHDA